MVAPRLDSQARLVIRFGAGRGADNNVVAIGLPVIAGNACEALFPDAIPTGRAGTFALFATGDWLLGCAVANPVEDLEQATLRLYSELIVATRGQHLCRIWNYVPAINAHAGANGLENYRSFSRGRSLAFERAWGANFKRWLPAASAVGSDDGRLAVVFATNRTSPEHRENPRQIPAYEYPRQYGPRPPSFARATIVPRADGRRDVFISGTAAITGHASFGEGDSVAQTHCTLANLREISRACDLGDDLAAGRAHARHIKIYLRHPGEYAAVAPIVEARLVRFGDNVSYVAAPICRSALNVEIEVTVFGAGHAT